MKIVTGQEACEALISSLNNSILDSHAYKRLLNAAYQPDTFLFFHADDETVPLVVKNGLATFYGGTRHNYATRLPDHPELLQAALRHLLQHEYRFQLVSILDDPLPRLVDEHQRFDVPYKVEWHYRGIRDYQPELLLEGCSGKKLWSWKRVFQNQTSYTFETLDFQSFEQRFDDLMRAHNAYFAGRKKASVWSGSETVLRQILTHFHQRHRLLIRLILHAGKPRAIYTLVHNDTEMVYYFGGSLNQGDHYISKIMYLDLLEQAREIARATGLDVLNGLAGAFTNKPAFRFSPRPLYALVRDPAWIARADPDLEPDLYYQTYGRTFGCECSQ